MKLFLLRPHRPWHPWYDSAFGFVVRAEDEGHARTTAGLAAGDEGRYVWFNEESTTCVELLPDGEAGVILRDFASA